jgi:tetraacyldisaccharide 4'-kinase
MRAPAFWQRNGFLPALLLPLASIYAATTAARMARPGWRAPVPVICCGNATVGGTGKTTLALDLGRRLTVRGIALAYLTRGYGGRAAGLLRVEPSRHDAREVGDEALLLAELAPTFVAADRAAGARMAVAAGARLLVMDDGLQNPSLTKDLSFLVIDGAEGFGNGRVIPAGPLREPLATAAARCQAAVLIGEDSRGARAMLPPRLPVLRASLQAVTENITSRSVFAFAGIGRPQKFFETLEAGGFSLAGRRGFPDHHPYSPAELGALLDEASRLGAVPVTTPKDAVRLPSELRSAVSVVGVRLVWEDRREIEALLDRVLRPSSCSAAREGQNRE